MKGLKFRLNKDSEFETVLGWEKCEVIDKELSHTVKRQNTKGEEVIEYEYIYHLMADGEWVRISSDHFCNEIELGIYELIKEEAE